MAIFEDDFVYTMIAYDALVVLPAPIRDRADVERWPEELRSKAVLASNVHQRSKRINRSLSPVLEEALLQPMQGGNALEHLFDVNTREGMLHNKVAEACHACKAVLPALAKGGGSFEQALAAMGNLAHYLIDVCNPFNLINDPKVDDVSRRFIENVRANIMSLPFIWHLIGSTDDAYLKGCTYMDPTATAVEAERRFHETFEPIANGYLAGNGYPAVRQQIEKWYDNTVNTLARTWLFCAV